MLNSRCETAIEKSEIREPGATQTKTGKWSWGSMNHHMEQHHIFPDFPTGERQSTSQPGRARSCKLARIGPWPPSVWTGFIPSRMGTRRAFHHGKPCLRVLRLFPFLSETRHSTAADPSTRACVAAKSGNRPLLPPP